MFLLPTAMQIVSDVINQTRGTEVSQEPQAQTNRSIHILQNGPFDQAMQSIAMVFKSFQDAFSLEQKTLHSKQILHEITYLRNAALQDQRAVLAANRHLGKEEFDLLELTELQRGRVLDSHIDTVMQRVTSLLDTEVQKHISPTIHEEKKQFFTFYQIAQKVFEITTPQTMLERQWEYVKYVFEEGDIVTASTLLKKIPLPTDVQKVFNLIVDSPTEEKIEAFFQFAEKEKTKDHIKVFSDELYRPKTLSDVLLHPTIMNVFLQYVNPLKLLVLNRSSHTIARYQLTREFVETKIKKASDLRSFSLATTSIVCRDILTTAVAAISQNGLEYQYLLPRLQNDMGIAKIALISILQKEDRAAYEKLYALFPESMQLKLTECLFLDTVHKCPIDLTFDEKNSEGSYLKFLAKVFITRFPDDADICRIMLQISSLLLKMASKDIQNNFEIVTLSVQSNGVALQFASEDLKNNEAIVMAAVTQTWSALFFASEQLKDNEKIVMTAVTQNSGAFIAASERLKDNDAIVMTAVTQKGSVLKKASERLRDTEKIVMAAITQDGEALQDASERLRNNENIVLTAVQQNGKALQYATEPLKDHDRIVLAAVQQNGLALKDASERLKNDEAVVLTAVSQNGFALFWASEQMKNRDAIVMAAVKQVGLALKDASERLKNDKAVVLTAVSQNGFALRYAGEQLRDNEKIVMTAITKNGSILSSASKQLQDQKDIVIAAVTQDGAALKDASERLRDNDEIVLIAVTQDGYALKYASKRLQDNDHIVFAAVSQSGSALEFASERIKNTHDFVKIAVTQDGYALDFASDRLKDTDTIVLAAVTKCGNALEFASDRLKDDIAIVTAALKQEECAREYASERLRTIVTA